MVRRNKELREELTAWAPRWRGGHGCPSPSPPPAPSRPSFIDAPEQASHAGPLEAEDHTVPLSPPPNLTPPPSVLSVDDIMDDTHIGNWMNVIDLREHKTEILVYGVYIIYLNLFWINLTLSLCLSLSLSIYSKYADVHLYLNDILSLCSHVFVLYVEICCLRVKSLQCCELVAKTDICNVFDVMMMMMTMMMINFLCLCEECKLLLQTSQDISGSSSQKHRGSCCTCLQVL